MRSSRISRLYLQVPAGEDIATLLHQLGEGPYMQQLQLARLDYLDRSQAAEMTFAENYVGLPASDEF